MTSPHQFMVLLPCLGEQDCSGGEVGAVDEAVGDSLENAKLAVGAFDLSVVSPVGVRRLRILHVWPVCGLIAMNGAGVPGRPCRAIVERAAGDGSRQQKNGDDSGPSRILPQLDPPRR